MPFVIQYILKFSFGLLLVYLFYQILLRRLTFYNWNRWYLLGYALLCFIIPFINVTPIVEKQEFRNVKIIDYFPAISNYTGSRSSEGPALPHSYAPSGWDIVMIVMVTGSLIMLVRLCIQLFSIWKMKRKAELLSEAEGIIYQVAKNIIPFSFGNAIFLNPDLHSEHELKEIPALNAYADTAKPK